MRDATHSLLSFVVYGYLTLTPSLRRSHLRTFQIIVLELSKYFYWILVSSPLSIGNILGDGWPKRGTIVWCMAKSPKICSETVCTLLAVDTQNSNRVSLAHSGHAGAALYCSLYITGRQHSAGHGTRRSPALQRDTWHRGGH